MATGVILSEAKDLYISINTALQWTKSIAPFPCPYLPYNSYSSHRTVRHGRTRSKNTSAL